MKTLIILLVFCMVQSAMGKVSTRICKSDGNTPLEYWDIMVGTKLTIFVDSNSATNWDGELDVIPNPNPPIGRLFGRGFDDVNLDYLDSHFPAAGDYAIVMDSDEETQQIFGLSAAGPNIAIGTWFVLDYNAMDVGDCTVNLVEYHGLDTVLVMSETFHHVRTRDFNNDTKVDFGDFATLASYWLKNDCHAPDWCYGADLDTNGKVDCRDLMLFSDYWLETTR
jgi:hypothetical protein